MGNVANLVPNRVGQAGPAVRHGAYSLIKLTPRAAEIRSELEERLPLRSDADAVTVDLLAATLAQLERALLVLGAAQTDETQAIKDGKKVSREAHAQLGRLSQDARGWLARAERLLQELGMTPHSRVRLGLEVVAQQTAVERLHDYLVAKRSAVDA